MYKLHGDYCTNTEFDIEMMEYKLAKDPDCLERKNYLPINDDTEFYLASALFDAASHDHDKCLGMMIKSGANIYKTYENSDIFEYCIKENKIKSIKYLINNNIFNSIFNPNSSQYKVNCGSNYYLFLAAKNCTSKTGWDTIEILLDQGVQVDDFLKFDISLRYYPYFSPTAQVIYNMVPGALKLLLLHGGIIDYRQTGEDDLVDEIKDCFSLIHHFAITSFANIDDSLEILNILYNFGANLWEKNRNGLTPVEVRQDAMCIITELSARGGYYDDNYYDDSNYVETERITEKMQELMHTPLTLQCWVRIALVKDKGSKYLKYVGDLEDVLPSRILKFLKADDLCSSNEEYYESDRSCTKRVI
jgi:hypothetical protein